MTEDPHEIWTEACERAIRDVASARFEEQADVAIYVAHTLLAVAHMLKGIACPACHGRGTRAYASTSTWRGGMGGAAITEDVCDKCWSSGRTDQTGPNLRAIDGRMRALEIESSRRWFDRQVGAEYGSVRAHFGGIAAKLRRARWGADFDLNRVVDVVADVLEELAQEEKS